MTKMCVREVPST